MSHKGLLLAPFPREGTSSGGFLGDICLVALYDNEPQKSSQLFSNLQTPHSKSSAIKILADLDIKTRNLPKV